MPVLFQFLDTAIASDTHFKSSSITKIFYALESFIEQLGTGLDPYLPMLMDKLFLALSLTKVREGVCKGGCVGGGGGGGGPLRGGGGGGGGEEAPSKLPENHEIVEFGPSEL